MIYNGIDLSEWDARTREFVRKHGELDKSRYEGWLENSCNGKPKSVEYEYLRHTGLKVLEHANSNMVSDANKGIEDYREAKRIFELLENLAPDYWELAKDYIKACNRNIPL